MVRGKEAEDPSWEQYELTDSIPFSFIPTQFSVVGFGGLGDIRHMFSLYNKSLDMALKSTVGHNILPLGQHLEGSQQRAYLSQFALQMKDGTLIVSPHC